MNSWKRIILVIFILIGGTMSFGYWSINQFDNAFDNLSASYVAIALPVFSSFKKDTGLASTSPEISETLATSTDETILAITSTTTTATATPITATSTDLELSFTFPQKGDKVHTGCTYQISWQSSTTINSLGTTLIDAGIGKVAGPIASGLAKENSIEEDSQNLEWKVGNVWPGEYYIKVSKINGVDTETRSKVFIINRMPANTSTDRKENICKESGGLF